MNKLLPIAIALLLSSCAAENAEDLFPPEETIPADQEISYSTDVKPIITSNCARCHDGTNQFRPGIWTNYPEIKARVDNGKFRTKVLDPGYTMPQDGPTLMSDADRDVLRRWVEQGAKNN